MVKINGAFGEGGGQILRSSLTLSALTGDKLEINHIRANRNNPGLRPQHLAAVKAIAKLTKANLEGAYLNSTNVSLVPRKPQPGQYQFDIPTAGALTLLLQTIFLPLSAAEGHSQVTITGGTHVPWSPLFHYLQTCWLPLMHRMGFLADFSLERAGFYPRGGGKVIINILPFQQLNPFIAINRGQIRQIRGFSGVANLEDSIAKRQKHQALKRLYEICRNSKIKTLHMPAPGKGSFILLHAEFYNGGCACYSALGAPGKPSEHVANEAVDQLLSFIQTDGCVDHYMADQLLLPLSIIPGKSSFRTNRLTQHLLTNAYVIRQFLPINIQIEGEIGQPALVLIEGIALK